MQNKSKIFWPCFPHLLQHLHSNSNCMYLSLILFFLINLASINLLYLPPSNSLTYQWFSLKPKLSPVFYHVVVVSLNISHPSGSVDMTEKYSLHFSPDYTTTFPLFHYLHPPLKYLLTFRITFSFFMLI